MVGPRPRRFLYSLLTVIQNNRSERLSTETTMALKVELKPGERIIIGECVITNADQRTRLVI